VQVHPKYCIVDDIADKIWPIIIRKIGRTIRLRLGFGLIASDGLTTHGSAVPTDGKHRVECGQMAQACQQIAPTPLNEGSWETVE
jgi:hypothetical protein